MFREFDINQIFSFDDFMKFISSFDTMMECGSFCESRCYSKYSFIDIDDCVMNIGFINGVGIINIFLNSEKVNIKLHVVYDSNKDPVSMYVYDKNDDKIILTKESYPTFLKNKIDKIIKKKEEEIKYNMEFLNSLKEFNEI